MTLISSAPILPIFGIGVGVAILGRVLETSSMGHLRPWLDLTAWILVGTIAIKFVWEVMSKMWSLIVSTNWGMGAF